MIVNPIKTEKITPQSQPALHIVLDTHLPGLSDGTIVAITSKIVSICEGSVLPRGIADKLDLIRRQADYFLPPQPATYGTALSITRNTMVANSGIDESNSNDFFVLWPKDPYATAEEVRQYLCKKFNIKKLGVIITDSASRPMQRGTTGVAIGYSGFVPVNSYQGTKDIFGREFNYQMSNVLNGLAATAVLAMGEGSEQTPLAILQDMPFVKFVTRKPSKSELELIKLTIDTDMYSLILKSAPWQKGELKK